MGGKVTFLDYQEAREYAYSKEEEGTKVHLTKEENKYVVYLQGKLPKIDKPRREIDTGITIAYKDTDTPNQVYNKLKRTNVQPKRNAQRIKEIAKEELNKANIKNKVELHITSKMSLLNIATAKYPKRRNENFQIGFHPLMEYVDEDFLRNLIRHEIEHLKKHGVK